MTPILAFAISLIAAGILAVVVFHPRSGLIARWKRGNADRTRSSAEDALKHAYDCEYRGIACTIESGTMIVRVHEDIS